MENKTQEETFFEWFEKVEPYLHLYNTRQVYDIGYNDGKIAGLKEALEVYKETHK